MPLNVRCVSASLLSLLLITAVPPFCRADEGATLFDSKCSQCHGQDGSGKTAAGAKLKVPDLRSKEIRAMSDKQLYETIAMGKQHKNYPHAYLYTGLTEPQILQIVAHIRSLK